MRTKPLNIPEELKQMPIWTISNKSKLPINIVETLNTGKVELLTKRDMTQTLDYYTLTRYINDNAILTITIPDGYMVLDVESYAPDDFKQYSLNLKSLYTETSFSGKGLHLLFKLPKSYKNYPNVHAKSIIKNKEKGFEFLFDHACIVTGNDIPIGNNDDIDNLFISVAKNIEAPKQNVEVALEPLTNFDMSAFNYLMMSGVYKKERFLRLDGSIDNSAFDYAMVSNWYNMLKTFEFVNNTTFTDSKKFTILYHVANERIYRDKFKKTVTANKETYLEYLIKTILNSN